MPSNDMIAEEQKSADIISSVLNGSPFKIRPDEEKLTILEKGRPLAVLNIIKQDTSRNCNTNFQSSWYNVHKWLCGSTTYNKLFCWPCLLMRPETSSWCSTGNDDMKRFTSLAMKHAACKSHLKAISEYDETLVRFGLCPEFANDLKLKFKEEEENSSDKMETDDVSNSCFEKAKEKGMGTEIESNSKAQLTTEAESGLNATEFKSVSPNSSTEITFKTWKEISKDSFPISKAKFLENIKLYKWKKKIAQQELKNARLTGEKLRFEIEVLKAKIEYYKSLKLKVKKNQHDACC